MGAYNPAHKAALDELLLGDPRLQPGKMFGYPAYYVDRKLCLCLYEQGVGLKLPESRVKALLETDPHAIPFMPMGRARMREWVQINLERSEDLRAYRDLFEAAISHVQMQPKKTYKKK